MKKLLLLASPILLGILFLSFLMLDRHAVNLPYSENENGGEREDGILLTQQQEFERTKDVTLGYIPKYRLISAYENAIQQRQMRTNFTTSVEALTWTERGSYADAVGPSNGNGRPGNGVTSGRVRAIWVDLADASNKTVWIGGIDGGIWKTNDITASPATWTLVNDFFGNMAIANICQDPSNTNTMYFGTGEKTFNSDAVVGGGVWKSTDHGNTWSLLPTTTTFYNVSKIVCDASGNVYVGTIGSGSGMQRSTDGGATWTNITPTTPGGGTRIADIELSSTGRMHVSKGYLSSAANQTAYFYTDNPTTVTSATWTSAATPFSTQYNVDLATNGNTLYALPSNSSYETPQIYKSTDGGANWAATATSPPAASGNNDLSSAQGWYCLGLAVDPANANNVIVGGLNCYKTTNGGNTWSQASIWISGISGTVTNYIHADQHIIAWNGNQVLVGSDGGIFYSPNSGGTFSDRNTNLRLKQFYSCAIHPTSTNYFLAGAQDNGVHQFNGSGLTTSVEVSGGDGAIVAIDQNEPSYQFGAYVYNHYHRSTNGGNTWSDFSFYKGSSPVSFTDFGSFINPYDYDDIGNAIYAGSASGEFFRWTNPQTLAPGTYHSGGSGFPAGVSIVSITNFGGSVTSVSVSPYTSNRVYFGTSGGKIVQVDNAKTIASGSAGSDITGSGMSASTVSCVATGSSDNYLLAAFSNYGATHVWMSSTGGGAAGWTNVSGNLPDIPVRWAMFYPNDNTQAILATEMGIYETTFINGASTVWVRNSTFPVVRTDMVQLRTSDDIVVAATHGRGLWSATLPLLLPASLVNFQGHLNNNQILLNWSTASEHNSKNFDIEKSTDGSHYYLVGSQVGAGNSSSQRNYNLTDKQVSELNYYRLKMVDIDGNFQYSQTILIKDPGARQNVWVLNNPFENSVSIRFAKTPGHVQCDLVNALGAKVYQKNFTGSAQLTLDCSETRLATGVYFLRVNADEQLFIRKLVKK
jgi:trimeric autotransporter adhesin